MFCGPRSTPQVARTVLIAFLLLQLGPSKAEFESAAEEGKLADLLRAKITKHSPPADMVNRTVFIYLSIYQIVDVDEKMGMFTMKFWMYIYYKLQHPLWDPRKYKNATRMQFLSDTFWKPDVG